LSRRGVDDRRSSEICRCLGSEGMGDVYCAPDTRLLRDVAIKSLNPAIAPDADLRRR